MAQVLWPGNVGGRQWKALSSCCLSVCLDFGGHIGKLHVMSCYAPTRAASKQHKDKQLNTFLSSLAAGDCFVILVISMLELVFGRVVISGIRNVLGPHAYGLVNDAGRELLSFLLCHEVAVCNKIHKQTWQHPKSKQWSCIDYVMMSQRDRKY